MITRRWLCFPTAALLLGVFSCSTLPSSVLSRQVLFSDYDKARPRVSPDGKRIAFLSRDGSRSFLWVRSFERDDARKLPLDYRIDQRGIWTYFWQGDSRHLLYLSDNRGDENFHVRRVDVDTAETFDLTPFPGARCGLVAMEPSHPDELLVEANARDARFYDLYRVELGTGKVSLVARNPGDTIRWIADSGLRLRAALYKAPGKPGTRIRVFSPSARPEDPGSGPPNWPDRLWVDRFHGISPDGRLIWFSSDWESNSLRLFEADLTTGERKVLASDPEFDVEDARVAADSSRVDAALFNRELRDWVPLSPWMKERLESLESALGKDFTIVSGDATDEHWIVRRSLDLKPPAYFSYQTRSKTLQPLFEEYPAIPVSKLHAMKPVHFTARDGMILYGYVTEPDPVGTEVPPMVLLVHGGPWARDSWGFDAEVQWLASRGYAVFQINFRGSSGFGNQYEARGQREWGRKMLFDLIDGKNWAVANHLAASGKIGLWGASYGGYATLAALTMAPDEFSCGVAVNGPANLETFMKSAPPYWKMSEWYLNANIGNPKFDRELLKQRSPLTHVSALKAPLLIVHGANDARVNRSQSDELVQALRAQGKTVSYLVLPEGGHTLQTQRYRSYLAAVESFFGKCLGGVAEPPLAWERWGDLEQ